jgi:hypothetical protein
MYALYIHSLLPSESDCGYIPPEFIYLILDIRKYMSRLELGKDLIDQSTWNSESLVVRNDMEWDIQFVKFALLISLRIYGVQEDTHLQIVQITEHKVYTLRTPIVPFIIPRRKDKESNKGYRKLFGEFGSFRQGGIILDYLSDLAVGIVEQRDLLRISSILIQ